MGCVAADDNEPTLLQGTWQSEEFPSSGYLSDIIYNFQGNNFEELISYKDAQGEYSLTENTGSFEILEDTMISESGLTAYKINLSYDRQNNKEYKQIAYINNGKLFLGNTNEVTDETDKQACEGDTYTTTTTEVEIVNGSVLGFEEVTKCFLRPTSLNLSFPYNKI